VRALPTTEASSLFQGALGLGYSIAPVLSFAVFFIAAAVLLLLVSFKMKWRET
jgi:hypothetical protein